MGIFNSDKICGSYCDFYFGVTFLEHTVCVYMQYFIMLSVLCLMMLCMFCDIVCPVFCAVLQQNKTVRQIKENLKDYKARANESDVCTCVSYTVCVKTNVLRDKLP